MITEEEIKAISKSAYKKANKIAEGDTSISIKDLTSDELKSILLTLDGMGRSFKSQVLDELIERAKL